MNWVLLIPIPTVILLHSNVNAVACEESFSEKVTITYLPNYNILADINFKLTKDDFSSSSSPDCTDLGHFPNLIHSLVTEFGLMEGKLAFTRGLWDWNRWGKAPNDPTSSGFQFHGYFKTEHDNNP